MEEFANFDFNMWRKRYMMWISHLKSRILDVFRCIDRDQDGRISQKELIDYVLASSKTDLIWIPSVLWPMFHLNSVTMKFKKMASEKPDHHNETLHLNCRVPHQLSGDECSGNHLWREQWRLHRLLRVCECTTSQQRPLQENPGCRSNQWRGMSRVHMRKHTTYFNSSATWSQHLNICPL